MPMPIISPPSIATIATRCLWSTVVIRATSRGGRVGVEIPGGLAAFGELGVELDEPFGVVGDDRTQVDHAAVGGQHVRDPCSG